MENKGIVNSAVSAVGALLAYLAGLDYLSIFALLLLMGLDIIVGVVFAMAHGEFKSSYMKKGLITKLGIVLLLLSLTLFSLLVEGSGFKMPSMTFIVFYFAFMEVFSIIETLVEYEVAVPKQLLDVFKDQKNEYNE